MNKLLKFFGMVFGIVIVTIATLGTMAYTNTGFVIINDGERGVKKSGTKYEMGEMTPGYHFYIPIYQSVYVNTIRPKLVNYSRTESDKMDSELLIYEPMIEGVDNQGVPINLAFSVEVLPVSDQLAEMYKSDGDFENSFYKKVMQPNREAAQSTLSKFSAATIMSERNDVETMLTNKIKENYSENPYFELVNINLKDIVPPEAIRKKQLDVQTAKQDALASKELIKKAEHEASSMEKLAAGKANSIMIEATAQAKANALLNESLTDKILKKDAIQKWNGVTPHLVGSESSQFIFQMKNDVK